MGRNAKVAIAAVAVVVLLGVAFVVVESMPLAIAVAVIGGVGIFFLLRQEDDDAYEDDDEDDAPVRAKRDPNAKTGKARLDEFLDDQASRSSAPTTRPKATPPVTGGLPTWTPGSVDAGQASLDDLDELDELTTDEDSSWDTWEKEWPGGDDADTLVLDVDEDPLAELDRLDDIDPVTDVDAADPFASLRAGAAVEETIELDALEDLDQFEGLDDLSELEADLAEDRSGEPERVGSSPFSFASAPAPINEEVSTADDIMAASTATELHVEEAGDSELARLLAKVQARLSAYE